MNSLLEIDARPVQSFDGQEMVIMPRVDYIRLMNNADALAHSAVLADVNAGREEVLSSDEMLDLLSAATPLAFWRRKRNLTQAALGERVGLSQAYIASLEAGKRKGDPTQFRNLSAALNVTMEDLVIG
jgi:DNA-binding XRE family transcriptional regulator